MHDNGRAELSRLYQFYASLYDACNNMIVITISDGHAKGNGHGVT